LQASDALLVTPRGRGAELAACMEVCILTRQLCPLPCIVEMDCLDGVNLIKSDVENRSADAFMLKEIKRLMLEDGGFKVEHIRREQNLVSHALAIRQHRSFGS
jgi:hypothetical protein